MYSTGMMPERVRVEGEGRESVWGVRTSWTALNHGDGGHPSPDHVCCRVVCCLVRMTGRWWLMSDGLPELADPIMIACLPSHWRGLLYWAVCRISPWNMS